MIEVTIAEAKTQFSKLVNLANQGEENVVTSGWQREPVARIVAAEPVEKKGRVPGMYKGAFELGPGFFEPLPEEELRLWNGEGE
jgi:antitoxin (DNA-binding transcriptional repressor) of toxin-antitoxin stability system